MILLMKSGEVKTQKQNYLVFFSDTTFPQEFSWRHPARSPLFHICLSRYHIATRYTTLTSHEHLADISWAYGDTSFSIRTDRIVQPPALNQKVPPSHGLGGLGKTQ